MNTGQFLFMCFGDYRMKGLYLIYNIGVCTVLKMPNTLVHVKSLHSIAANNTCKLILPSS